MFSGLTCVLMLSVLTTHFVVTSSVTVHTPADGQVIDANFYEYSLDVNEATADEILCPSYCDNTGQKHERKYCINLAFCCITPGLLDCCNNESLQIGSGVNDNFNCSDSPYWKTVLGVCVPVGTLCFIGIIVLLVYQYRVPLRHFLFRTPPTDITSRRNSVCSSASYSASVTSSAPHHIPDIDDVEMDSIFSITVSPVPPPYVSAEPPQYSDIYPTQQHITNC